MDLVAINQAAYEQGVREGRMQMIELIKKFDALGEWVDVIVGDVQAEVIRGCTIIGHVTVTGPNSIMENCDIRADPSLGPIITAVKPI